MLGLRFFALKRTTLLILAILFVTVLCNPRLAAQEQMQVVSLHLVSSARVGTTQFDYTYRVDIRNEGAAARGVTATVTSSSPDSVVVGHGNLAFGDIPAGEVIS